LGHHRDQTEINKFGRVFTRTELCERVWEHPHEYDTKLVEVFIWRLRRKIGEPPLIHTVRHIVTGVLLFPNCTKRSATTRCGYSCDAHLFPTHRSLGGVPR